MDNSIKEKLIRIAQEQAENAISSGNAPFGAVLSDLEGNMIAKSHNTTNTSNDPTAHAEINLIRNACTLLNTKNLGNFVLISNAQSCSMCISAAIQANISNFLFGAPNEPHLDPNISVFDISQKSNKEMNIETGILEEECRKQIEGARKNS